MSTSKNILTQALLGMIICLTVLLGRSPVKPGAVEAAPQVPRTAQSTLRELLQPAVAGEPQQPVWVQDGKQAWLNYAEVFPGDNSRPTDSTLPLLSAEKGSFHLQFSPVVQKLRDINDSGMPRAASSRSLANFSIHETQSILYDPTAGEIVTRLYENRSTDDWSPTPDPVSDTGNPFLCAPPVALKGERSSTSCATVVKLVWAHLPMADCPTDCRLSVYENPMDAQPAARPGSGDSQTPSSMWLDMNPGSNCAGSGVHSMRGVPGNRPHPQSTSLNCFHYVVLRDGRYLTSRQVQQTLRPTDHVFVLTGFHVAIADVPDWSWASYGWSLTKAQQELDRLRRGGPSVNADGFAIPWSLYAGVLQRYDSAKPADSTTYANAYIEHGLQKQSSCLGCHSRATHRTGSKAPNIGDDRDAATVDSTLKPPPPLLGCFAKANSPSSDFCKSGDAPVTWSKPTHFLWTLQEALAEPGTQVLQ